MQNRNASAHFLGNHVSNQSQFFQEIFNSGRASSKKRMGICEIKNLLPNTCMYRRKNCQLQVFSSVLMYGSCKGPKFTQVGVNYLRLMRPKRYFCFVVSSVRIWESATLKAQIVECRTAARKIEGLSSEQNNTQGLEISENELPLQRRLKTVRRYICKIPFQKL